MATASRIAVRFVAASNRSVSGGSIHVGLHVKPGVDASRPGITEVTEQAIEHRVAVAARDGEANRAVIDLLSNVLGVPKSRLQFLPSRIKSRVKTAVLRDVPVDEEGCVRNVLELLKRAIIPRS